MPMTTTWVGGSVVDILPDMKLHIYMRPTPEELGELCAIANDNRIRARNYLLSVSSRWNKTQRIEALQVMFLAATAESELGEGQIKLLSQMRELLDLSEQEYQAAIEEVFMGRNAGAALKLGQARGSAIVACLHQGLPLDEYSARSVKQAIVGRGAADKQQVQHMVKVLLGVKQPVKF